MTRAGIVLVAVALVACGGREGAGGQAAEADLVDTLPVATPAIEVDSGMPIVSPERVREWQEAGEDLVLLDARDSVQYGREHIPGAINVPYVEIRAGARLPDRDRRIVVYCSSETCPISQYAYQALDKLGYAEIYDMRAGLQGWKEAGFPTAIEGSVPEPPR